MNKENAIKEIKEVVPDNKLGQVFLFSSVVIIFIGALDQKLNLGIGKAINVFK